MIHRLRRAAFVVIAALAAATAQAETLKVGSTPTGVPFTFLNTQTGKIDGMMVDLITAMAKDSGYDVEIVPMAFSTLVSALTAGKIDIISAAMSASPARQQVVDFTPEVMTYGEGLVVPANDKKEYHSVEDLRGYHVGLQIGTTYVDRLRAGGVVGEISSYDSLADIIRDVNAGRIEAGLGDFPILAYNFSHMTIPGARLVQDYKPFVVGPINIAVRKDEGPLLAKLDATLAKFKQDGTLTTILAKWNLH